MNRLSKDEYIERLEEFLFLNGSETDKELLLEGENFSKCPKCYAIVAKEELVIEPYGSDDNDTLEYETLGCSECC